MATTPLACTPSSRATGAKTHPQRRNSLAAPRRPPPTLLAAAVRAPMMPPQRATAAEPQQPSSSSQEEADGTDGEPDALELQYGWKGKDAFSALGDRVDAPPPPLPPLKRGRRVRVVLVRHGQSTWNAEGRVQGSSDGSELTDKGKAQARAAGEMLASERFSRLFVSPLRRARQTAEAIAAFHPPSLSTFGEGGGGSGGSGGGASAPSAATVLPSLREIDLYAFQGLLKARGKARHGAAYAVWQRSPERFELKDDGDGDGAGNGGGRATRAPVRELWHRAGLAWREILSAVAADETADGGPSTAILVVAHNAVNQALVGAALGLGPEHFRRLLQSNGAATVVDFASAADEGDDGADDGGTDDAALLPARAALDRLNETAGGALAASLAKPWDRASKSLAAARVVLVRTGTKEEEEAVALAAVLAPARAAGGTVAAVLYAPGDAAAEAVARRASLAPADALQADADLAPPREGEETRGAFWRRTRDAWRRAVEGAADDGDDGDGDDGDAVPPPVVVVLSSHAAPLSALVGHAISGDAGGSDDPTGPQACACLGGALRFDAGGATVVDLFSGGGGGGGGGASPPAVVRTLNAALGARASSEKEGAPLPPMPEAVAGLLLD